MSVAGGPRWPVVPGYEVINLIGKGGFGVVYEARQLSVGRTVALKVISGTTIGADTERRFRSESRTIGSLSWHHNVVSLFDAGTTPDGDLFLAMELLPGGSIGTRVRAGQTFTPAETAAIGADVASALDAAHQVGVLHRDVKPDNLFLDRQGGCQLGDFGIATLDDGTRSATGSFTGTYAYSAPELLRGERATPRSDVYSLGATLYTLAAGRAAFTSASDSTPAAVLLRVISEPPPPMPAEVPPALAEVILTAMAKEPGDRYASAAALLEAIAPLRTGLAQLPPPVAPSRPPWPTSDEDEMAQVPTVAGRPAAQHDAPVPATVAADADEPARAVRDAEAAPGASAPSPAPPPPGEGPPSPPPARTRGRRKVALGVAAVAALVTVVAVAATRGSDDDPPRSETTSEGGEERAEPEVGDLEAQLVAEVPGGAWAIAPGDGIVWAISDPDLDPDVVIDESTSTDPAARPGGLTGFDLADPGSVVRADAGTVVWDVATSPGRVWVAQGLGEVTVLTGYDDTSLEVVAETPFASYLDDLLFADGSLWAVEPDIPRLHRIDPASGASIERWPLPGYSRLASDGESIWAISSDGATDSLLHRLDLAEGALQEVATVPGVATRIAASADGVWIAAGPPDTNSTSLYRLAGDEVGDPLTTLEGYLSGLEVIGGTVVWAVSQETEIVVAQHDLDGTEIAETTVRGSGAGGTGLACSTSCWILSIDYEKATSSLFELAGLQP